MNFRPPLDKERSTAAVLAIVIPLLAACRGYGTALRLDYRSLEGTPSTQRFSLSVRVQQA